MVTEKGLVLNDETVDRIKSVNIVDQAIQFAIDKPFDNYNSNLDYTVS